MDRDAKPALNKAKQYRLEALLNAPGWRDLQKDLAAAEERYWARHVADIRAGKALDQREIDFMAGKFAAVKAILNQPARAARMLERAEKQAEEANQDVV